jgi:DNA-binding IclR family transcriptional regulator
MLQEQPSLRVADVARSLGVAPSTAHRLLAMLQYHGFVSQDAESKAYRAGAALIDLGLAIRREMDVRTLARPSLESIAQKLGETAHLGVLDRGDALFLDSVEGTQVVRVGSRIGIRLPAHVTALGKAMLARLPQDRLRALYPKEILPGRTPGSIVKRSVLLRALAQVTEQGYALNEAESAEDVGAVAVAILTHSGAPAAAISVSAPLTRFDKRLVEQALPLLRSATDEVSKQLF